MVHAVSPSLYWSVGLCGIATDNLGAAWIGWTNDTSGSLPRPGCTLVLTTPRQVEAGLQKFNRDPNVVVHQVQLEHASIPLDRGSLAT